VSHRSLEDLLGTVASPVELLRNSQTGANVFPGVPPEFTNWRDEQQAWQETCVLFNQSYHMNDLAVEGPDALKLLSHLAVNSFDGFGVDRAKHFVPCSPDGYVIGDVILFALGDKRFNLVGRAPALNWIIHHAEAGGYDVTVELDLRTALRTDGRRRSYRFQVQGPNAMQVIEKALGGPPPELRFFHTTQVTIAGKPAGALRHGMVGQPGWELFGPWDDEEAVREALVTAGGEFGLRQAGGRAYSSNTLESGWIPSPLPAVYSGEACGLPRVAAGGRVRGLGVIGAALGRHRGLLLHAVGPRCRTASSSTTTSSDGRRSRRWPTAITARRSPWRSTTRT
jgi:syringate O-demethylase